MQVGRSARVSMTRELRMGEARRATVRPPRLRGAGEVKRPCSPWRCAAPEQARPRGDGVCPLLGVYPPGCLYDGPGVVLCHSLNVILRASRASGKDLGGGKLPPSQILQVARAPIRMTMAGYVANARTVCICRIARIRAEVLERLQRAPFKAPERGAWRLWQSGERMLLQGPSTSL